MMQLRVVHLVNVHLLVHSAAQVPKEQMVEVVMALMQVIIPLMEQLAKTPSVPSVVGSEVPVGSEMEPSVVP